MNKLNTEKSKALHEKALQVIPGAASSVSRTAQEGYVPYPLFIDRAEGARLYDVDGNEYIDYLQALGPTLVGHANPRIINFVTEHMQKGTVYGLPYEMQIDVAEKLIRDVPSFEKVSFMNSGTEVIQMALRLARAYTKKDVIVKFEGHYHGWLDNVAISVHPPVEKANPVTDLQNIPIGAGILEGAYKDLFTPLEQIRNYRDCCQSSPTLFMTWRNKMLEKRIFIRPAHFGELYVTAAHTDEDIDRTLRAMEDVLGEMKEEKLV